MAAVTLTVADLTPFAPDINTAKAEVMIADALALAAMVAPCLTDAELDATKEAAAKAVIRGAVLRWEEAGTGALVQRQQTLGSTSLGESYDNRQLRRGMFWPSEIRALQNLCSTVTQRARAFEVDTMPPVIL